MKRLTLVAGRMNGGYLAETGGERLGVGREE